MAVNAKTAEVHSLLEVMPSRECHCHHCGARIAEGDAVCAACGKKQQVRERRLLDFLIAHTKDSITGRITDSIYEAVKNFMLSHLFGVVVSISLVAAVGVTVYATEPYIERVTPAYSIESEYAALIHELDLQAQELGFENAKQMLRMQERWDLYTELFGTLPEDIPAQPEMLQPSAQENESDAIIHMMTGSYLPAVANEEEQTVRALRTAESLRCDFGYAYNETSLYLPLKNGNNLFPTMSYVDPPRMVPADFLSAESGRLAAEGHTVAECIYNLEFDDANGDLIAARRFLMVLVKTEDGWKVAGDCDLGVSIFADYLKDMVALPAS